LAQADEGIAGSLQSGVWLMVRITGPQDVAFTQVNNTRRVIQPAANDAGARLAYVGAATKEILDRARDQQIENQVADAEMKTRLDLDALRGELEQSQDDPSTYEKTWEDRARQIVDDNAAKVTSPRHQQLWRQRMDDALVREHIGVTQLVQQRVVQQAQAGFIESVGSAQRVLVDENATPEARAAAMTTIETLTARAVQRRTIAADDGARVVESARGAVAAFEREAGLRQRAQGEEDRIWAAAGGDMNTALEMARDLDGSLRDDVTDRLVTRFSRQGAAERQQLDDSMERAYTAIERSGNLDSIAPEDRAVIVRNGQLDTLRTYLRSRAGVTGSDHAWTAATRRSQLLTNSLLAYAEDNQTAATFGALDLNAPLDEATASALGMQAGQSVRAQVMPDDYMRLRRRQREETGEIAATDDIGEAITRAYNAVWRYAQPLAQSRGVSLSSRKKDAERVALFRGFLMAEVRDFVTEKNRTPSAQDIQQITELALMNTRGPGVFNSGLGRTERRVFEAHQGARVIVRYSQIPDYQRQRMTELYDQSGLPTPDTKEEMEHIVEQMYAEELVGRTQ
jgi:hypothetical protein